MIYEYWDLEDCTLSNTDCAKVMKALIKCKGCFTSALAMGSDNYPDRYRSVFYRVKLPKGSKEKFEEISGKTLKAPAKIVVNG
jgi:hypothetical protein